MRNRPSPVRTAQPGVERRKSHPSRAKHGYMQLILTQSVPHLGQSGDLVKVRPGFARNCLVPQGLATFATQNNLRMVEKHRQRLKELEEARRSDLQTLAAQIAQRSLTIEANANAEGHLYGSVNADQIAETLRNEGFPIQAENIRIEGPAQGARAVHDQGPARSRNRTARSSSGSFRPTPTSRLPERRGWKGSEVQGLVGAWPGIRLVFIPIRLHNRY